MATRLEIVTPKGRVYSDDVDIVVVPGSEGELGVLSSHVPLVTPLKPGELRISKAGKEHSFAVGSGFLEVTASSVTVLSDLAVDEDEIDEFAVTRALEEARKALANPDEIRDPDRSSALQLSILNSMAQLELKKRKKPL